MDLSRISQLYALANKGDFQTQRSWLTDTYRHHVLALGIDWDGPDEALAGLEKTWQDLSLEWTAERVEEHGVFAVSYSTVKSSLRPEPFKAVNVYRLEGDLIAEGWVFHSSTRLAPTRHAAPERAHIRLRDRGCDTEVAKTART